MTLKFFERFGHRLGHTYGLAIILSFAALFTTPAHAIVTASIDLDTVTPGVQDTLDVTFGDIFSVDVVVDPNGDLILEWDAGITFDDTVLTLLSGPTDENYFGSATGAFTSGNTSSTADAFDFDTASSGAGNSSFGSLFSLVFEVIATTGSSALAFTDVFFGNDFGTIPAELNTSTITISSVPEPSTLLLMSGAFGLLAWRRKQRN